MRSFAALVVAASLFGSACHKARKPTALGVSGPGAMTILQGTSVSSNGFQVLTLSTSVVTTADLVYTVGGITPADAGFNSYDAGVCADGGTFCLSCSGTCLADGGYTNGYNITFSEVNVDPQNPSSDIGPVVTTGKISSPDSGVIALPVTTGSVYVSWAVSSGTTATGVYLSEVPVNGVGTFGF